MTKKILFTILQFFLFLFVLTVGTMFWHPFNLHWGVRVTTPGVTHYYVPDGLLLAIGVFFAIVLVQAIRKRLCNTTWTIVAFLAAIALGWQVGFVTH